MKSTMASVRNKCSKETPDWQIFNTGPKSLQDCWVLDFWTFQTPWNFQKSQASSVFWASTSPANPASQCFRSALFQVQFTDTWNVAKSGGLHWWWITRKSEFNVQLFCNCFVETRDILRDRRANKPSETQAKLWTKEDDNSQKRRSLCPMRRCTWHSDGTHGTHGTWLCRKGSSNGIPSDFPNMDDAVAWGRCAMPSGFWRFFSSLKTHEVKSKQTNRFFDIFTILYKLNKDDAGQ